MVTLTDAFFDVQQQQGTPDVIAVQFANVDGIIGAGGALIEATSAEAAAHSIPTTASSRSRSGAPSLIGNMR